MTSEKFLAKMGLHFRLQMDDQTEQNEWLADAYKAILGTAPNVLEAASEAIIRDRASPFFPTIGEIRHAIQAAALRINPPKKIEDAQSQWPAPTPEMKTRVNDLVAQAKRRIAATNLSAAEKQLKARSASFTDFEAMQRASPNAELHSTPRQLSDRSRRIMGDAE
ncbi:MAG: hypothetical protein K2X00_10850 [Nitrospiraceae bacterium]|nr:hypothetical protein [Nitrospiraceae bacterium]